MSTSSSEVSLPRLIAKMEHLGVSKPVVGVTVPTGYSFNLDGTAIYLTMSSLFIANALGTPLNIPEQISLLCLHDHRLEGRGRPSPVPASRPSPAACRHTARTW